MPLHLFLDPTFLIKSFGLAGVLLIIFAESGLFFGFFLPGDSLLFTAGFLASQGFLPAAWLFVGAFAAAALGDSVGYAFGKKAGPALFAKEDSFFFDKRHIARAKAFFEKYGGKAIVMARFVPAVRTFTPIMAGVGEMRYRTFLSCNLIGALAWTALLNGLGYSLGAAVPNAGSYVTPLVLVIIIASLIPPVRGYMKMRKEKKASQKPL